MNKDYLLERRQEASDLRKTWIKYFLSSTQTPRHPLTISTYIHQHLTMNSDPRHYKCATELSDNRISNRGNHFLPQKEEYERNLATPKYFTQLNTRQEMAKAGSISLDADDFKTLTSGRLDIPMYQVPSNLPELSNIRGLLQSEQGLTDPKYRASTKAKKPTLDLNGWINLLTRPVTVRPDFAQPIYCKTPQLKVSRPGYQKPTKGVFKTIDKKAASREFTVHPEFMSELVRIQQIQGQSSNPLKYGWA